MELRSHEAMTEFMTEAMTEEIKKSILDEERSVEEIEQALETYKDIYVLVRDLKRDFEYENISDLLSNHPVNWYRSIFAHEIRKKIDENKDPKNKNPKFVANCVYEYWENNMGAIERLRALEYVLSLTASRFENYGILKSDVPFLARQAFPGEM